MHQSFVSTAPPPPLPPYGDGQEQDFLKIKALLKSLHCGDKWKVTALLFSPTPGRNEKAAFKCYRPHPDQAFPSEMPAFAAVNSPFNLHMHGKKIEMPKIKKTPSTVGLKSCKCLKNLRPGVNSLARVNRAYFLSGDYKGRE